jgi:hypothetical protein
MGCPVALLVINSGLSRKLTPATVLVVVTRRKMPVGRAILLDEVGALEVRELASTRRAGVLAL